MVKQQASTLCRVQLTFGCMNNLSTSHPGNYGIVRHEGFVVSTVLLPSSVRTTGPEPPDLLMFRV